MFSSNTIVYETFPYNKINGNEIRVVYVHTTHTNIRNRHFIELSIASARIIITNFYY